MVGFIIQIFFVCTIAVFANGFEVHDHDLLNTDPRDMPAPKVYSLRGMTLDSAFGFRGHIRDQANLLNIQPGESQLTPFFQQTKNIPNSPYCNLTFTYEPKAVFDEDSFLCPKTTNIPYNFPQTDEERLPTTALAGQVLEESRHGEQNANFELYMDLYMYMLRGQTENGRQKFKQCASRNHYNKPRKWPGYKIAPACRTRVINYSNRPVLHRVARKAYPCYIPHPVELKGVDCVHPNGKSNFCRLGYATDPNYVCVPSNFIRRRIPVFCPSFGVGRMLVRIPQTCSCKMCYKCRAGFEYNAYSMKSEFIDMYSLNGA